MADRKKNRRKFDEDEQPTKEDYAVAKFLRFNVPTSEAKLHSMEVHCFYGSAAVDALMSSKWSASKNAKEPLFYNRNTCVNFCQKLIQKGLFHRAERVLRRKDKGDKSKKKKGRESATEKEEVGTGDELRERKGKKEKKGKKEEMVTDKVEAAEKEGEKKKEEKKEEKKDEGKKKKEKRLKLVMTDDQRFLDGDDNVYVWVYDPVNAKTLIIGSLIVLGAIGLCLFPLWPECVRIGVYYVSLAGAGFVGFILALVIIRLVLFCCIWTLSMGRHHFWLLPNLTEDVGFFESFRPLYKHDMVTKESSAPSKDKEKSSKSAKKSTGSIGGGKTEEKESKKDKSSDREETESEPDEFEMIDRGDFEEGEEENNLDVEEEEEDYDRDEDEEEEEEELNGEEEDDSLSKKDK